MIMHVNQNKYRPQINTSIAISTIKRLYGYDVKTIKELCSYDDKNFHITVEDNDSQNSFLREVWPHGYVFKLLNYRDSMQSNHVEAEHEMMKILNEHGYSCPLPVPNKQGKFTSREPLPLGADREAHEMSENELENGRLYHTCRMLTYLPGSTLHSVPYTQALMEQAGECVADLQLALKDFYHQALSDLDIMWRMERVPSLRQRVSAVRDEHNRKLALDVINTFEEDVMTQYENLPKGVIHGDVSDHNIIVSESGTIKGFIDFGDASYSYYVFDIAITMMYLSLESTYAEPLLTAGHVLKGYLRLKSLSPLERSLLKYCVAARYAQSAIMGEYCYNMEPDNAYLLITVDKAWPQLHKLWNTPTEELYKVWGI